MKTVAGFMAGVAVCALGAWLMGFDFDKRGPDAFMAYVMAICCGCLGSAAAQLIRERP